ncbi:MAG: DUF6710 family protein, partial [Bacteriovorax sp.]
MINFMRKFFITGEAKKALAPEEILGQYLAMAKKIEKYNAEDVHKLIKILGRKIQYEHMNKLITSNGNTIDDEDRKLGTNEIWFSMNSFIGDKDSRDKINLLIREKELKEDLEVNLADDIVLPWPWNKERIINSFRFIGKDRQAGEWKYDKTNH